MGFFDDRFSALEPEDEQDEDLGAEEPAYLGGVVPVEALIAKTDTAAVAVRAASSAPPRIGRDRYGRT